MGSAKTTYEVHVAGLPLKVRSSHDEEMVQQLVDLVDQKVKEALESGNNISFQNALLLSSLHIAEELVLLKKSALAELNQLEDRTLEVLTNLESSPMSQRGMDQ